MKYRRKANKMKILTSSLISAQFLLEEQPRSTMSPSLADLAQVDRKGHILRREDGGGCDVTLSSCVMITMMMMQWSGSLYCTMPFTKLHVFKEIFGFTALFWPLVSL